MHAALNKSSKRRNLILGDNGGREEKEKPASGRPEGAAEYLVPGKNEG